MKTYDYYCTWQAQNIFCQEKGVSNRDYLDEEALFKKNGLAEAFLECRKDLYFILDDNVVYHCGASINRIGHRTFSINIFTNNKLV